MRCKSAHSRDGLDTRGAPRSDARPDRAARLLQPLKFALVGAVGYVVNLLAFGALFTSGMAYGSASVAAYLLSNVLMYLGNRYFTFGGGGGDFWSAYGRYLSVGLVVATLNAALLSALVEGTGLDPRAGQAVSLLLITPVAFLLSKRWAFRPVTA